MKPCFLQRDLRFPSELESSACLKLTSLLVWSMQQLCDFLQRQNSVVEEFTKKMRLVSKKLSFVFSFQHDDWQYAFLRSFENSSFIFQTHQHFVSISVRLILFRLTVLGIGMELTEGSYHLALCYWAVSIVFFGNLVRLTVFSINSFLLLVTFAIMLWRHVCFTWSFDFDIFK